MSKDQIIYYYDKCPTCGKDVNDKVCPYCGASLIKSVQNVDLSDYNGDFDAFETELNTVDSTLPVVTATCGRPSLFNIIFGGTFFGAGAIILIAFLYIIVRDPGARKLAFIIIPFLSIFIIIGLVPLIKEIKRAIRTNKVNLYGNFITGEVRGYQRGNVIVNGVPEVSVRVLIHDPDKKIVVIDTHSTKRKYEIHQSITLKSLGGEYLLCE